MAAPSGASHFRPTSIRSTRTQTGGANAAQLIYKDTGKTFDFLGKTFDFLGKTFNVPFKKLATAGHNPCTRYNTNATGHFSEIPGSKIPRKQDQGVVGTIRGGGSD